MSHAQPTTEHGKHQREHGSLEGARGMAWFGFCFLSSVCVRSVFSVALWFMDVIMPWRSVRPSVCRVSCHLAVG